MTEQEIFDDCIGYATVSDDGYKKTFVFKEKDGQILYPFQRLNIRRDSQMPSIVHLLYPRSMLTIDEDYSV